MGRMTFAIGLILLAAAMPGGERNDAAKLSPLVAQADASVLLSFCALGGLTAPEPPPAPPEPQPGAEQ